MNIRTLLTKTINNTLDHLQTQREFADTVIGEDMHELARNGKIVLDLSNQTLDPLVEAMNDWRAFSWRISRKVQYGVPYNGTEPARRARRFLQLLNP